MVSTGTSSRSSISDRGLKEGAIIDEAGDDCKDCILLTGTIQPCLELCWEVLEYACTEFGQQLCQKGACIMYRQTRNGYRQMNRMQVDSVISNVL